jgi:hypothetical protein
MQTVVTVFCVTHYAWHDGEIFCTLKCVQKYQFSGIKFKSDMLSFMLVTCNNGKFILTAELQVNKRTN